MNTRLAKAHPAVLTALMLSLTTTAALADVAFRYALDDSPLDVSKPIKGETFTDAVKAFHVTGVNAYNNDAAAIAKGKEIYDETCAACHNVDATGRMGPSLIDGVVSSSRANTDVGKFEIIHSGSSGAMRSFTDRGMTQDQILHVIAYINTLKK